MQKILIVEDDALNSALTQMLLERNGYECDSAGNSAEALLLFRKARYDAVLMDILLPGTSGIETMKAIKRLRPEIPVVAVTEFPHEDFREMLLQLGFAAVLEKPYLFENLYEILKEHSAAS